MSTCVPIRCVKPSGVVCPNSSLVEDQYCYWCKALVAKKRAATVRTPEHAEWLQHYGMLALGLDYPIMEALAAYRKWMLGASAHAFPRLDVYEQSDHAVTIDPVTHLVLLNGAAAGNRSSGTTMLLTDYDETLAKAMGLPIFVPPA